MAALGVSKSAYYLTILSFSSCSKSIKIRQLKPGIDVVSNGKASSVVSMSSDPMSTPLGGDHGTMSTPSGGDHGTKSTPSGGDHGTMSTPSGGGHGTMLTPSGEDHCTKSSPSGGDHGTMSTLSGGEHGTSIDAITTVYDNRSYTVDWTIWRCQAGEENQMDSAIHLTIKIPVTFYIFNWFILNLIPIRL